MHRMTQRSVLHTYISCYHHLVTRRDDVSWTDTWPHISCYHHLVTRSELDRQIVMLSSSCDLDGHAIIMRCRPTRGKQHFTPTKRRFWKAEQTFQNTFSKQFQGCEYMILGSINLRDLPTSDWART